MLHTNKKISFKSHVGDQTAYKLKLHSNNNFAHKFPRIRG